MAAATHGFSQLELLRTPHGYGIAVAAGRSYRMERGVLTTAGEGTGLHHGVLHA